MASDFGRFLVLRSFKLELQEERPMILRKKKSSIVKYRRMPRGWSLLVRLLNDLVGLLSLALQQKKMNFQFF